MTASAEPAAFMRLLISAGLRELTSKVDLWEVEDREEIAESIDEVRGMTRWAGRSPGIECMELTEEDAERSGSGALGGFGTLFSSSDPLFWSGSGPAIIGDCDELWPEDGGAGNVALATRAIGDRFWEGEGLEDPGDKGLCEEEPSMRYD
jgi:hypothetical protein